MTKELSHVISRQTVVGEAGERSVPVFALGSVGLAVLVASLDVVAIFASHWMAGVVFIHGTPWSLSMKDIDIGAAESAAVLFVILAWLRGLYGNPSRQFWQVQGGQLRDIALVWLTVFAIIATLFFLLQIGPDFSRGFAVMFFLFGLLNLTFKHMMMQRLLAYGFRNRWIERKRVALVELGAPRWSAHLESQSERAGLHMCRTWIVVPEAFNKGSGDLQQALLAAVQNDRIDEVIIAAPASKIKHVQRVAESLRLAPIRVRLLVDPAFNWLSGSMASFIGDIATIELSREPLSRAEQSFKRLFDVIVASAALVVLSPFLVLVALAIRLDSSGPVLFRQSRDGFNGRSFMIYKFRSMTTADNGPVVVQAKRHDPRVTRVGAFIRRTSIDELPQLINVLRGEMSIVGPRPHAIAHGAYFSQEIADYAHRHHVKPGLTGWAQVNGSRGETPTVNSMKDRVDLDIWYIANWSVWLDARIILRTIRMVLFARDAY